MSEAVEFLNQQIAATDISFPLFAVIPQDSQKRFTFRAEKFTASQLYKMISWRWGLTFSKGSEFIILEGKK